MISRDKWFLFYLVISLTLGLLGYCNREAKGFERKPHKAHRSYKDRYNWHKVYRSRIYRNWYGSPYGFKSLHRNYIPHSRRLRNKAVRSNCKRFRNYYGHRK